MNRTAAMVVPILALLTINAVAAHGEEHWPRFRGPNGAGVSDARIPAAWTDGDFRWTIRLPGVGHGSPIVWGGRIFLNAANEDGTRRFVVCVDARDGSVLWQRDFDATTHRKHQFNSYATATPAVDAERVYTSWSSNDRIFLRAITHDGKDAWQRDLGPVKGGHGFGASPIVFRDLVVINLDQDGPSTLVALDRGTGEPRWVVPRNSKRLTYSTPCVYEPPGKPAQLIFTNWQHGVTSIDPDTGKQNWEMDVFDKPDPERAIGSPVVAGELVIGTCGFVTKKKQIVAIAPAIPGVREQPKEAWRIERAVPHVPTILVHGDLAYLWDDLGVVTCIRHATGEVVYRERVEGQGKFYSSPVYAGGTIFGICNNGQVSAIAAGEAFMAEATLDLGETCQATPAFVGGDMIVRSWTTLRCVKGHPRVN